MIFILVLLTSPVTPTIPKAGTKAYKYQTFSFPPSLNISDEQLIIKDLSSFVRNHSARAALFQTPTGNKTALRIAPWYYDPSNPHLYHMKLFDLMKQSIYVTQDRLRYMHEILDKCENDQAFRMAFIFSKLDQLLEDMRRIYSYAVKKYDYRRVLDNIIYFRHLTKKNVDITYLVESLISFHNINMKKFKNIYSQIPKAGL